MIDSLALTISPPDRVTKYDTLRNIYFSDMILIDTVLHRSCSQYIVYPELDIEGRLHYHAKITIKDKIKFYRDTKPKLGKIGYIKIKKLNTHYDKLRWLIYISKEWGVTKEVLEIQDPIYKKKLRKTKFKFNIDLDEGTITEYYKITKKIGTR